MLNIGSSIRERNVSYYEYGDVKNPTIVCLHGLAGNSFYSFGELVPYLKEKFHIIIIDSPGHGKTPPFAQEEQYLFSNLAAWLHYVIGEIVTGSFYILGHSWGADAALHFTRFYPDKVLGLILLDGGFTFPQNQPEMTFDYAYSGWNNYMEQSVFTEETEIPREYQTYTNQWNSTKEQYAASLFHQRQDGKFELVASKFTVLAIIKAFFKEPFAETYPFIKVPTLLIYAEQPKSLETARTKGILQLRETIKDITAIAIPDSFHMLQWDKPEQTASLVINWVNEKM
ncbi:pimeloyl-ACP methyl ester carboxylesterase [Planomicrobium stackebrandtii]|uniref:Pimeloyl-ACP methyl ester carboxylesterase n=1 Tax=Planomicrobium stackebrandtii TaxID=253160 RepID=A0ABU0GY68_9BACL|nr:alpha/beta hydrolase [Planomicrobium stackebrandtii]MDQ0430308.1 pimeloyl-ACP methyl ester carboxylesterase [Planomicrobium stackebrandtii]